MPIILPSSLPAYGALRDEGVMVMSDDQARRQDIRPLRIGLLNLMPTKVRKQTEIQFGRLFGSTPLQIDLQLIRMTDFRPRDMAPDYLRVFYRPFSEVRKEKFDGLIITGAPIEHLSFEEVTYWEELQEVMQWTQSNVHSTFGVCWGGMAMLWHFHRVEKHMLPHKAFGCFRHRNLAPSSPYLRGFSDECIVPVSRWTMVRKADADAKDLQTLLMGSEELGPCLIQDSRHRAVYVFNHFEYDRNTLKGEYDRDIAAGKPINLPGNYFPNDDPTMTPRNSWRSHGHLLYGNWINEIYQTTPFDPDRIGC